MSLLAKFYGQINPIGLDIGSHAIKVAQLKPARQGMAFTKAGSTPTPPDAVKGGVITNTKAVSEAISSLLDASGLAPGPAVAAVAGPTLVVRQVEFPLMTENQLRKSIQWEVRNYISFPVEDSVVEFQLLGTSPETAKMQVMLVATPRDMVDSRMEALEMAGLDPLAIEIEPFAAMRTLVDWNPDPRLAEETVALVGMGASYTEITLVKQRQFVLSRVIPIAGNSFTEAISSVLSLEMEQANVLKETAVRVVESEEERATLDPFGQQASRAIEPLLEELVREVRRSLAYYDYQQQPEAVPEEAPGVNRILLWGGSSKIANLADHLSRQLKVPVEPANLFSGQVAAPPEGGAYLQEQAPSLVVATGLALRQPLLEKDRQPVAA